MNSFEKLNRDIIKCNACPRLRDHCQHIAQIKRKSFMDWTYWGRPIPNLGDPQAQLLIVGLAPAAHGANRTGQMFTGDRSGDFLFQAMYETGFASHASATEAGSEFRLTNSLITSSAHCAPPENKPTREELAACRPFLERIFETVPAKAYIALGKLAWDELLRELNRRNAEFLTKPKFAHGAQFEFRLQNKNCLLVASYHPSQQNTFTGKLTPQMMKAVFETARGFLNKKT